MAPKTCQLCHEAQSKYKCPSCLVPYCSLACFKIHKGTLCVKSESPEVQSTPDMHFQVSGSELPVQRTLVASEPSEMVKRIKLDALASSTEIRDMVKDKRIQDFVCQIDRSADAKQDLDKAMSDEDFRIFTEKILAIVSPGEQ